MVDEKAIRIKYQLLRRRLHERARRHWAAAEAMSGGKGAFSAVVRATGISPTTLSKGLKELRCKDALPVDRIRRPGAGRKRSESVDSRLSAALEDLIEPGTRGDPMSPLRWTCKSTRNLADELGPLGYDISHVTVARLLRDADYSLQANRKTLEGTRHPDRDKQFAHINARAKRQIRKGEPVISVDTKKKELVGKYRNGGREWHRKASPENVKVHDFIDRKKGKAIPYGVYDLGLNVGWVSVGVTHDTAAFAVETIRKWWRHMGKRAYPMARSLMITADSGGSNGARTRLWKYELQQFANESGLAIHVSHFPPGTSKWNKVEHRLFSFITQNWRGKPLYSLAAIVNLIAKTTTRTGLKIRCMLDHRDYPKAIKIADEQMAEIDLTPDSFHGDWNYTIDPVG
jgi:hypothetical protein